MNDWTPTNSGPIKTVILDGLRLYASEGIPTGGFLRAVLENDLRTACERADTDNARTLYNIVSYIVNELPASCHGTPSKVKSWIDYHAQRRETKDLFEKSG